MMTTTQGVEDGDEVIASVPTGFAIDCAERANWLLRKVLGARAYGRRVRAWAEREQRRAEREEKALMYLFGRQLEAWAAKEIAKHSGRRKSVNLPAGTVGFRREDAKFVIEDEDAVMAWARLNLPAAIRRDERLVKGAVRSHFEATGELPPTGVRVEPAREAFRVGDP